MITLGYDIGGTKIELVAYNVRTQKLIFKERIPTERHKGYKHILSQIQILYESFRSQHPALKLFGVGFALPGTVQNNVMIFGNTLVLKNKPILKDLRRTFGRLPLFAENDANCFVLAEHFLGAGKKFASPVNRSSGQNKSLSCAVGFILGTGMGSGIIVNDKIFSGSRGAAGEIGHIPLPTQTFKRKCYCGQINCTELFLSGPGFRSYICKKHPSAQRLSPEQLLKKYIKTYQKFLALKLASVINTLDPIYIVLGGGLSTDVPDPQLKATS